MNQSLHLLVNMYVLHLLIEVSIAFSGNHVGLIKSMNVHINSSLIEIDARCQSKQILSV